MSVKIKLKKIIAISSILIILTMLLFGCPNFDGFKFGTINDGQSKENPNTEEENPDSDKKPDAENPDEES